MVLYPEVLKKAQAEIDSVVGSQRLPTFEDREQLPYIEAIIMETMRWHPVAGLGMSDILTLKLKALMESNLLPNRSRS